jgi:hypothetical protein
VDLEDRRLALEQGHLGELEVGRIGRLRRLVRLGRLGRFLVLDRWLIGELLALDSLVLRAAAGRGRKPKTRAIRLTSVILAIVV